MICAGSKECPESGVWVPVIVAYAKGYAKDDHEPLRFHFSIAVCEGCRKKMDNIRNFLTPEGRSRIKMAIYEIGKAEPDLDGAALEWDLVPPNVHDVLAYVMAKDGKPPLGH